MHKHSSARIKVGIRVRRFLDTELRNGYTNTRIDIDRRSLQLKMDDSTSKTFEFDYTFGQEASQQDVYNGCEVEKLVDRALEGYHSTIFAYGQTGSGKTYTMQGVEDESQPLKLDGIIPRLTQQLFAKVKQQSLGRTFTVSVSFLQIYNERIFDLLNPSSLNPRTMNTGASTINGLRLRWNKNEQFCVQNLFIFQCKSAEELSKYFTYGLKNRINSAHKLNMTSSRSHSIFSVRVESFDHRNPSSGVLSSRIELVDLAGSERIGLTGTEGKLAKQSIDINKSLFTLRQVISTLADWNKSKNMTKQQSHIPYRDSKLTSILKQSIGGNSYCLMIACISPNDNFFEENMSTLTYATKATMITNKPVINDDPRNKLVAELRKQVHQLNEELAKANRHIELFSQQQRQSSPGKQSREVSPGKTQQLAIQGQLPAFRKKLSEKISSASYDQFSDRLVESINMVRQLLRSNKQLRQSLEETNKKLEQRQSESYDLEKQNENLRQKLAEQSNYILQLEQEGKAKPPISRTRYTKKLNTTKVVGGAFDDEDMQPSSGEKPVNANTPNFRMSATQVVPQAEGPYNSLHSLEINNIYMNETGMDSMPTNFNKRESSTSQGERARSNTQHLFGQRYRQTFTSSTNKRLPFESSSTKNRLNHTATTAYRRHPYS